MDASLERSLDDVIEALRHSRDTWHSRGCSLLIGAGCSATAGIATAAGFVRIIEEQFKAAHGRAASKMSSGPPSYPKCMAELAPGQQRNLINEQVRAARINWAHVAIAQLMKHGYVDRVLTTNFDPLVLRACAMIGEFPAVYDFAISQLFRSGELPEKAIFHLHGQSTGFVLMNTDQEVAKHSRRLGPLFQDAGQARPWIVVGYSGDNDPVFDHLARIERFDHQLFWVAFKDEVPARHVREKLLRPGKDAYVVRGYDADSFFVELAQKLECFPPQFVQRPFSFMLTTLSALTEYRLPSAGEKIDILHRVRELVSQAVSYFENNQSWSFTPTGLSDLAATALLMAGKYQQLQQLAKDLGDEISHDTRDLIAWSLIEEGNLLTDQLGKSIGKEADAHIDAAKIKYISALEIAPNKWEGYNNWGNMLLQVAKRKTQPGEAINIINDAYEKFTDALKICPDNYIVLYNWANALSYEAKISSQEQSYELFDKACLKYRLALDIMPDFSPALLDLGIARLDQAIFNLHSGSADVILEEAITNLEEATKLEYRKDDAFVSLGTALMHKILFTGDECAQKELIKDSIKKFEQALDIAPDNYKALFNLGNALHFLASVKSGAEQERLEQEAQSKYRAVEQIKKGTASHVLAAFAARRGDAQSCQNWLKQARDYGSFLVKHKHTLENNDFDSVRNEAWFQAFLSEL